MHDKLAGRCVLPLYFPEEAPENTQAAQNAVNDFYRCGETQNQKCNESLLPPPFSYGADSAAIIAAFQREYGIDLTTEKLHWWRFRALLDGLLQHSFSERVRYRSANPAKIKSKELRAEYQHMRQVYALDIHGDPVHQPETLAEYNASLLQFARGTAT